MSRDRPFDRGVEVTVTLNVLNVRDLAENAWRLVNKQTEITGGR